MNYASSAPLEFDSTVLAPFKRHASETPAAIAVEDQDGRVTYEQLSTWADAIAAGLIQTGSIENRIVGIYAPRSASTIAAMIGTMQAGAAFVVLDSSLPAERLAYIIQDCDVPVILHPDSVVPSSFSSDSMKLIPVGTPEAASPPMNPPLRPQPVMAVLYTSGSTGRPKGVVLPHQGIASFINWAVKTLSIDSSDRMMFKSPLSFDPFLFECFAPLVAGATVVCVAHGREFDTDHLVQAVLEQGITMADFVPSALRHFIDHRAVNECVSLRVVSCGGESMTGDLVKAFYDKLDAELLNFYGPTEASISVTMWQCRRTGESTNVPIGQPIADIPVYLLGDDLSPVPSGHPGEIYIGGPIALGYLNDPDSTTQRFVSDPFGDTADNRMFRTGDMGSMTDDGAILFLGRKDRQAKFHGVRVELEELESVARSVDNIKDAAVVLGHRFQSSDPVLRCFLTLYDALIPSVQQVKERMHNELPRYMHPNQYYVLERLPLTSSGKVDYRELSGYAAPSDVFRKDTAVGAPASVQNVLRIWSDVLGIDAKDIGLMDTFFGLGGYSLLAATMTNRVRTELRRDISIATIFEAQSLGEFAAQIEMAPSLPQ